MASRRSRPPPVAAACAELAFAAADSRSAGAADVSIGADDGDDDVLSAACPHIRRADVTFLLPHVAVGNSSWRSLFNTEGAPSAASETGRSSSGKRRQKHHGKVFGLGLSKTGVTSLREALFTLGWRTAMGFDFYPRVLDSPRDMSEALHEYFYATTDAVRAVRARAAASPGRRDSCSPARRATGGAAQQRRWRRHTQPRPDWQDAHARLRAADTTRALHAASSRTRSRCCAPCRASSC